MQQRLAFERLREASIDFAHGVVLVESRFQVWWANDAFLRLVGLDLSDIEGQDIREMRRDDRPLYPERVSSFESEYRDPFGDPVPVLTTVVPIFEAGSWVGHMLLERTTAEDVADVAVLRQSLMSTESLLKESKLLYQALYENSTDLIQSTNARGELMFVNESWRRLMGYSEREASRLTMDDVLVDGQDELMPLFRGEAPAPEGRIRVGLKKRSQETLWVEGNVSFREVHGRVVGTHAILADITERERLERMKNQFVAMVNHELRTPLTSIIGSLNLLVDGVAEVDADAQRFLEIALRNANRLSTLVQEVLDFEKLAAGKLDVEMIPFDLCAFLAELRNDYEGFATSRRVEISEPECPRIIVETDPALLRHVVGNFLANAIRFAGDHAKVRFGATAANGVVRVWVNDLGHGLGIPFREHAFRPFEQDENTSGGTGLGLNIAASMAERIDASVGFISLTNIGSTFFADLPFAEAKTKPDLVNLRAGELTPAELVVSVGRHPNVRVDLHEVADLETLLAELSTSRSSMVVRIPSSYDGPVPPSDYLTIEPQKDQ